MTLMLHFSCATLYKQTYRTTPAVVQFHTHETQKTRVSPTNEY